MSTTDAAVMRRGRLFAALAGAIIAIITLTPGSAPTDLPPWCVVCGEFGGVDIILNVALFVPYGIGLWFATRNEWRAILIAAATTVTVELLQLSIIPNRDSNIGDVLSNTTGGVIGVLLAMHWRSVLWPSARHARRLATWAFVVWAGIVLGSGWLLHPAPTDDRWYGQWTPDLRQFARFGGTLLDATLNGTPLSRGVMIDDARDRTAFTHARTHIEATVIAGDRRHAGTIAPIASVFDEAQREILLLGQEGINLVYRARTYASVMRMREPTVVLPRIFPNRYPGLHLDTTGDGSRLGDTLHLAARRTDGVITLDAHSPVATRSARYALHLFLGWNALLPFTAPLTSGDDVWSTLWALALLVIPGYWLALGATSQTGRRRAVLPLLLMVPVCVLALGPLWCGLPPSPWWAWAGSAGGLASGWGIARAVRRLTSYPSTLEEAECQS